MNELHHPLSEKADTEPKTKRSQPYVAHPGAGGGDDEGYMRADVFAKQTKEFQAEYTGKVVPVVLVVGGKKFDTSKTRTDLLPAGALTAIQTVFAVDAFISEAPWAEVTENLMQWRCGSKTHGGLDRMAIVAAGLLVLLTREIRGDVRISSLFPDCGPAILAVAEVLTFGAQKYGANNWQQLQDFSSRYYAALLRHVLQRGGGETHDPESKLRHLAHAACGAVFLLSSEVGFDPVA